MTASSADQRPHRTVPSTATGQTTGGSGAPYDAPQFHAVTGRYPADALTIPRYFTQAGRDPYEMVSYERRSSVIRETDGREVFRMDDVEVPTTWSQVATDILAQKYFRKTGVPQLDENGELQRNSDGSAVLGTETSIRQVVHRLAGCWRHWGEAYGYFASPADAQAFYDEVAYMLLTQAAAPNSPQWFNTGLHWAYGIEGTAQGHWYVDPETGELQRAKNAYEHPQPHACQPAHALVSTPQGPIAIGEIVEGNRIGLEVYDRDGVTRVVAVKSNGTKPVLRVTLANGNNVEATADHLVWAAAADAADGHGYQFIEVGQLTPGMRLLQRTNTEIRETTINTMPLLAQTMVASWLRNPAATHRQAEHGNGQPPSPVRLAERTRGNILKPSTAATQAVSEAVLAGWLQGDGFVGQYREGTNRSLTVEFITCNDDEFDFLLPHIDRVFAGMHRHVRLQETQSDTLTIRRIRLYGENLRPFVERFALDQRGLEMRVPEPVRTGGREVVTAYLRSLFQADGTVRHHAGEMDSFDAVLATVSETLMRETQQLLANLGIYSRLTVGHDTRGDRQPYWQLSIGYKSERTKFADRIGFISTDKQDKLAATLTPQIRGKAMPDVRHETIRHIEYLGVQPVYDIQTESGTYLSGNVVVHNCFIQSVNDDLVNEGGIMDLWVREARLFKYGSGTGTNFSTLRARNETLSGGGKSSGLPSWLKIGDAAAGGIKSGGTTRRAAKMVILNIDHPDVEWFINWKVNEEKKVAAMVAAGYDAAYEGEAYQTVSGQNSNNSVRIPDEFIAAVQRDEPWQLTGRVDPSINRTVRARDLWQQIARAAWACADPGVQYDTTINDWNPCPQSGKIRATNPCSEYVFLDNTACNLASINLAHFYDVEARTFDVAGFTHAARLWTTVLEISVLMSASPSREIADGTYRFRTLGLGYANLGSMLMTASIPYDSPTAFGFAGAVTALMTGESYRTSAELARALGPFPEFTQNRADMLRVIRNHRRAAYDAPAAEYEGLHVAPVGIPAAHAPADVLTAAQAAWDAALAWGERYGYRNAQVTLLAPTGTIGLLMDCATTGVEPDFALVKFKKLAGGGYFKIVNEAVPVALRSLGYPEPQVTDIIAYCKGHGTLAGAPAISHDSLAAKGFTADDLAAVEHALAGAFDIAFTFTPSILGPAAFDRLGVTAAAARQPGFSLLAHLGFSPAEIAAANEYVCGTMTIEGAPHLKPEHYAIFDCANKCGVKGTRYIHFLGHVRMLAAVQPFLSGSISKTINMPHSATIEDVEQVYAESWKLALKCLALYRDGCKLSQPLSTSSKSSESREEQPTIAAAAETAIPASSGTTPLPLIPQSAPVPVATAARVAEDGPRRIFVHGEKRELPYKRGGITVEAEIAGHKVFLRTGEYPDGSLGEIFIDMYKEGVAFRSIMNSFAVAISTALKYGVPLEKLVNKFTFTRFDPAGPTTHPNIRMCTSVLDFVFRVLAMEYLGRFDLVQVPPTGIQRNRAEQLAHAAAAQDPLPLATPIATPAAENAVAPLASAAELKTEEVHVAQAASAVDAHLATMMGDAPMCDTCGHIMVRNAACYRCLNCGSTSGCS